MTLGNLFYRILETCPYHLSLLLLSWKFTEQVCHNKSAIRTLEACYEQYQVFKLDRMNHATNQAP